jgi:hypothetical protein
LEPVELCFETPLSTFGDCRQGLIQHMQPVFGLTCFPTHLSQPQQHLQQSHLSPHGDPLAYLRHAFPYFSLLG